MTANSNAYTPKYANPNYKGYQQFEEDLAVAQKTEVELSELLARTTGMEILHYNEDYRYDTCFKMKSGNKLYVEIKEDFTCQRTGNVGLEYSCRGKDSGIRTSEAHLYFYKLHTPSGIVNALVQTSDLKKMIFEEKYFRTVNGGDPGSNSLNYLFKLDVFLEKCKVIS